VLIAAATCQIQLTSVDNFRKLQHKNIGLTFLWTRCGRYPFLRSSCFSWALAPLWFLKIRC